MSVQNVTQSLAQIYAAQANSATSAPGDDDSALYTALKSFKQELIQLQQQFPAGTVVTAQQLENSGIVGEMVATLLGNGTGSGNNEGLLAAVQNIYNDQSDPLNNNQNVDSLYGQLFFGSVDGNTFGNSVTNPAKGQSPADSLAAFLANVLNESPRSFFSEVFSNVNTLLPN